ncbi:MAG: hypothetical protein JWO38_2902 [Gemmataceae bacterium]|nr:hypothetical protein [Gemmataceae bacterium]
MFGLLATMTLAAWCPREDCADEGPVRVTVVVVLASTENAVVDPKLTELAKEVRKRDPKLTGFKLVASDGKSIAVGDAAAFDLVDKKELQVKVEKPKNGTGRVGLTIKPPELGEITYTCTCDKFFPVVTPYKTKTGETLIVVVSAKPCTQKK